MSFDRRDIRPSMDVYTLDNAYLGTVLAVVPGPDPPEESAPAPGRETSAISGEALGPMPTMSLGNGGPLAQGARSRFASRADRAGRPLAGAELLVLRTPIGLDLRHPLPRLRRVPLSAVQTVSLERITLRVTAAELDAGRA